MAAKTLYFKNAVAGTSSHGSLQDGGTAPTAATSGTGWNQGLHAIGDMCMLKFGTEVATGSALWSAIAKPAGAPGADDCYRSENAWTGTFANTNWDAALILRAVTSNAGQRGRARIRFWKGSAGDGSNAVEMTSGTAILSTTGNISNTADQTSSNAAIGVPNNRVFENEFLFAQLAWEVTQVASNANGDADIRVGAGCRIITADFTENRRARLFGAELEAPLAPRRARIFGAELQAPVAPRRARLFGAELEVPNAPRRVRLYGAELESPSGPRRARIYGAEMQVPTAPRRALIYAAGMSVPLAPRRARIYGVQMETPSAPTAYDIYTARFYEDDGETIAFEFSTDPLHAHPYLRVPEQFAPQEIDFAAGRATIGGLRFEVVDVPTDLFDQTTGFLTSKLSNLTTGESARIGRRVQVLITREGVPRNMIDGPLDGIELHESLSSFLVNVKDQRENERKTRAFTRTTTSAISPRGVIDGFGLLPNGEYLVPPVTPLVATVELLTDGTTDAARLNFAMPPSENHKWWPTLERILTPQMVKEITTLDDLRFAHVRVLWRPVGGTTWNAVENPLLPPESIDKPYFIWKGSWKDASGQIADVQFLGSIVWTIEDGQEDLTDYNGDEIEVVIGYAGPASKSYPFHFEGTIGELAVALLSGELAELSGAPTKIDEAAFAAMTEPCILRVTEELANDDGIWKWMENNIYGPYGYAPTIDADGLISPITYALPTAAEVAGLVVLDDSNCEPIAGWRHSATDAINVVEIYHPRLYRVPAEADPLGDDSAGDGLAVYVPNAARAWHIDSLGVLGEKPLRFGSKEHPIETLCALGGVNGEPLNGDGSDEFGSQLAGKRGHEIVTRFPFGGMGFPARVMRSAVGELKAGQFVIGALPWMPAYESGVRGPNRIAQLMRVLPLDSQWYEIEANDVGPEGAAAGLPTITLGALRPDGSFEVACTAAPAGESARVEYAISTLEPAEASPLWRFAGVIAVGESLIIPPSPSGATLWVRRRGEKAGKRPSSWGAAVSVAIGTLPRITEFHIVAAPGDQLRATWKKNSATNGVRLYYQSHAADVVPSPVLYVDVDADDLGYTFDEAITDAASFFTVQIVPYSIYSGGSVSGVSGTRLSRTVAGTAPGDANAMIPALEAATNDEDQPSKTAYYGVIVRDPFGVRTRLLVKYRIGGLLWDADWTEFDAAPLNNTEYVADVHIVKGHPSGIMFGLEYDLGDGTSPLPISPSTSPAFDLGLRADVMSLVPSFTEDNFLLLTATADFDTDDDPTHVGIAFNVALEVATVLLYASRAALFADLAHAAGEVAYVSGDANPAYDTRYVKTGASGFGAWAMQVLPLSDPTPLAYDYAIYGRSGYVLTDFVVPEGRRIFISAVAINTEGDAGDVLHATARNGVAPVVAAAGIQNFSAMLDYLGGGSCVTHATVKLAWSATGSLTDTVEIIEFVDFPEAGTVLLTGQPLVETNYQASAYGYKHSGSTDTIALQYRMNVKNSGGDIIATALSDLINITANWINC